MLKRGTQIIYVPSHAYGDENHPDVEIGFVMRDQVEGKDNVFCRFWRKDLSDLRTKANSESTPISSLVVVDTVTQSRVDDAIREILENG